MMQKQMSDKALKRPPRLARMSKIVSTCLTQSISSVESWKSTKVYTLEPRLFSWPFSNSYLKPFSSRLKMKSSPQRLSFILMMLLETVKTNRVGTIGVSYVKWRNDSLRMVSSPNLCSMNSFLFRSMTMYFLCIHFSSSSLLLQVTLDFLLHGLKTIWKLFFMRVSKFPKISRSSSLYAHLSWLPSC